ncbi:fumarylacetoacetate hydrolase family protein [Geoalkalibacter subterraneus]|uniref:Acylpyruvase n=1 Tax=Geoalkalibacter subterraneus TaxID=483547 RepID=A0A0B5FR65_9BACT|nr:fumarylacetoacetate hydrolase family protein [Geoalkalibacter subterraneus]AJF07129.1 acylpyruvase [Geoalkalibacter subterraneus]
MHMVHMRGSSRNYNVGKIICLGRNYAEHARELGNPVPKEPVIFLKPATAIIRSGEQIVIPSYSNECHHEVEMAVLIGGYGRNIEKDKAHELIAGYAVALDMALRDVQNRLKKQGLPWEIAKGFDTSCPLSDFTPRDKVTTPERLGIRLSINGAIRQEGNTDQMILDPAEIIAHASTIFTLEEGDIILTGTPAGVGPVRSGDQLRAEIDQLGSLEVSVR